MNKTKSIAIILVILILAGVVYSLKRSKVAEGPIKIGSILSLTGDFAPFGESINQGAQLALDEAKDQGLQVEYFSEDDRSTANGSTTAANKLVRINKVDAVFTATLQEVKPAAPVFSNTEVPLLATWDSNDFIKSAGPNIFSIGFSTEDAGHQMARYAYNNLGVKKAAVIPQLDEWSEIIAGAFEKEFTSLGGQVVLKDKAQPTQKDYRTLIAKIKTSGADGVYFPFLPTTIAPFLSQSKQLGFTGKLMTADSFSMDEISQAGTAAQNVYFTNLHSDNSEKLAVAYQAKYGMPAKDPLFVSFGYDGMKTLIAAAQLARKEHISPVSALRQTKVQGTDAIIDFSGKQFSEKLERLYKVDNGQFVEVK